jgi:chromosome segregation ATPase
MIEPIMFFGIGFLVASLIGLVFMPLVHGRAVRLTSRRLEASTPLSMAEIQADKDQLRAEFAMSTRRLELAVEQMKARTTTQLAELSKKGDTINRLKLELGEKTAAFFAIESREKALKEQLRASEDEFSVKTGSLREMQRSLAEKEADLSKLAVSLDERSNIADSQRVEIVALRTQVEALRAKVDDHDRDVRRTHDRLERERDASSAASEELGTERGRVANLGQRVADFERQLMVQTAEAETMARRVQDLEQRLDAQSRALADRELECNQLKAALAAARKVEGDLRAELAEIDRRHNAATEGLRAAKEAAEGRLKGAQEERAQMQHELIGLKRKADSTWESERVESALLRERINDVAAEISRLTLVLEGPGSPIEVMLIGGEAAQAANGKVATLINSDGKSHATVVGAGANEPTGTLVERIRALQSRASRLQRAN